MIWMEDMTPPLLRISFLFCRINHFYRQHTILHPAPRHQLAVLNGLCTVRKLRARSHQRQHGARMKCRRVLLRKARFNLSSSFPFQAPGGNRIRSIILQHLHSLSHFPYLNTLRSVLFLPKHHPGYKSQL